ncbi:MAG: lipid-A-disaccharide synthase [Acidobacteriota bacterium]|nr:lipid-A-disaccharide synthase [Acidobacteriota bacterium]
MVSCGEPSGDLYAGALVRELRARDPQLQAFGLGGERLAGAGADLVADFRGLSVTGLTEALRVLPRSWSTYRRLLAAARERRPDVLVLIDYPDFNFRLMRAVKALGVPIVYYISPQLWAWRPGRMKTMQALVDRVLVIFPFEEAIYRRAGVDVQFVGHPLVELAAPTAAPATLVREFGLDPSRPTVALLPGSRSNELTRLAPVLVAASRRIDAAMPGVQFVVARAPHLSDAAFTPFADAVTAPPALRTTIVEGRTDDVLSVCDVVLTASGTATVQTAIHGKPMVVLYKLSPVTYALGKPLAQVDMYAMVNLIAGRRIVRELIQDACTPKAVADEAVGLLADESRRHQMSDALADVMRALGGPGASGRAADAILDLCARRSG